MRTTTDNPYLFQMVKEAVDITEAARRYGLDPDRKGWCCCPFHNEKTASFHLHNQRFACFGCGVKGDVIDLVAGIRGIDPLEAVRELNVAFRLGIDLDAPVDTTALARAREVREKRERFKRWRNEVARIITGRLRDLRLAIVHGATSDRAAGVSDRCARAMTEIDQIEYYFNIVAFGEEAEVKGAAPVLDAVAARIRKEGQL